MTSLALDLSTKSTGWAVFQDGTIIDYGFITATSTDLVVRIQKIVIGLKPIIEKYRPTEVIVEEVRPPQESRQNLQTHRALMWLQGAVGILIHEIDKKIKMHYIYPSEWRSACGIKTGPKVLRETQKKYDIDFVHKNFGISVNDDVADAIGIGYGYNQKQIKENSHEFNFGQ